MTSGRHRNSQISGVVSCLEPYCNRVQTLFYLPLQYVMEIRGGEFDVGGRIVKIVRNTFVIYLKCVCSIVPTIRQYWLNLVTEQNPTILAVIAMCFKNEH